jgi:AcrR family transcriptional regulator
VSAARAVFLERGFHGASVEEISARAGYSTGAVYSNFNSKDELFLALLDERSEGRTREFRENVLDADSFEEGIRTAGRLSWQAARETPEWIPVLTEFWIHVAGRDGIRRAASESHHAAMDAIGDLIEGLAERHGMEFTIPARDVARGSSALVRGVELERLLDPQADEAELFEEMWMAFVRGIARPARGRRRRREQPTP